MNIQKELEKAGFSCFVEPDEDDKNVLIVSDRKNGIEICAVFPTTFVKIQEGICENLELTIRGYSVYPIQHWKEDGELRWDWMPERGKHRLYPVEALFEIALHLNKHRLDVFSYDLTHLDNAAIVSKVVVPIDDVMTGGRSDKIWESSAYAQIATEENVRKSHTRKDK